MAKFLCGFLVAVLVYGCARSQVAAPDDAPRRHLLQPETRAALLRAVDDARALDAEARCKSNRERLESGECDRELDKRPAPVRR